MFNSGQLEINEDTYNFPRVVMIIKELGAFDFGIGPIQDGIEREKKPLILLENGAKYEGEWLKESEVRDGRGI
jgi:hypothetical protein